MSIVYMNSVLRGGHSRRCVIIANCYVIIGIRAKSFTKVNSSPSPSMPCILSILTHLRGCAKIYHLTQPLPPFTSPRVQKMRLSGFKETAEAHHFTLPAQHRRTTIYPYTRLSPTRRNYRPQLGRKSIRTMSRAAIRPTSHYHPSSHLVRRLIRFKQSDKL